MRATLVARALPGLLLAVAALTGVNAQTVKADAATRIVGLLTTSQVLHVTCDSLPAYFAGVSQITRTSTVGRACVYPGSGPHASIATLRADYCPTDAARPASTVVCSLSVTIVVSKSLDYAQLRAACRRHFGSDGMPVGLADGSGEQWYVRDGYYLLLSRNPKTPKLVRIQVFVDRQTYD